MTAQHDAGSSDTAHRGNYAAMWNRVDRLRRDRARKGPSTGMIWIQSHVQDEAKRVSTSPNIDRECACMAAMALIMPHIAVPSMAVAMIVAV